MAGAALLATDKNGGGEEEHKPLPSLSLRFLGHGGEAELAAEAHGFDGGGGDNDHGPFLFHRFVQHVHRAEVEGRGVAVVDLGGGDEFFGGFGFGLAEDDAGAAFTFGLCFAGHGVFQGWGIWTSRTSTD